MTLARRFQFKQVANTIAREIPEFQKSTGLDPRPVEEMSYQEIKDILTNAGIVPLGIPVERYTAMVLSMARGGTNRYDVFASSYARYAD